MDMKLGPVTKLNKENTAMSKKIDDDIMSASCNVIVIFSIYVKFGVMQRPDFRCTVLKTYLFTNINLLSYKN